MSSLAFPRWIVWLLPGALVAALLSLYAAGDWRTGDVALYHGYALGFWSALGHPLLPAEYPPLALLPFALTLTGPQAWFADVFAWCMAAFAVLGYLAFRRWNTPAQAGAYAVYALAAGVATLVFRYDIVPVLLTVAALWLIQRRRFAAVYPLIALATLLKLYPLVLLPVAAIAHWQSPHGRAVAPGRQVATGVITCLTLVAAGFGIAYLMDPAHGLGALTYQVNRPIEVESIPATLVWLGSFAGFAAQPDWSFGGYNLMSSLGPAVTALSDAALVAGFLWTLWQQARGRFTVGQTALAVVLVVLCTNKVLSAQYLLWVAPLLATTVGFQLRWLFLCLLTSLIFPTLFEVGIHHQGSTVTYSAFLLAGIAVRNTLLLACGVRFLFAPGRDRGAETLASPRVTAALRPRVA